MLLKLHTQDQQIITTADFLPAPISTPAASLPTLAELQDPANTTGRSKLTQALGGAELEQALTHHPADTLYLEIPPGDPAHLVAWEFATLNDGAYLVCRVPFLRLITDRPPHTRPPTSFLQFLALGADPLVKMDGQPRDEVYQLQLNPEMRRISRTLKESEQALRGQRLPPTAEALRQALGRPQPTLLHLSCHGSIYTTPTGQTSPVLHLEDPNGREMGLFGRDLLNLTSHNNLLLILLSACHTSSGYTNLTEQVVRHGVPAAVGMQGAFPDDLSDELACALYQALLAGHSLGPALRQARLALHQHSFAIGLPVGYVVRGGDTPLPLQVGSANLRFNLAEKVQLPPELTPPQQLFGRHLALYELAHMFSEGAQVVTITGTGGMGKTALSASFAQRFGWRWPEGVVAYSFANTIINGVHFRQSLAQGVMGKQLPDVPAEEQEAILLKALPEWEGLLLIDNYESVQERVTEGRAEAMEIHRLLGKMARSGTNLLLTSRNQPVGLPGERLYPHFDRPLPGLAPTPGQQLFFHHSPKARDREFERPIRQLARQIAEVTGGHPLAIALLGSEFQHRDVLPADFLANWPAELQMAKQTSNNKGQETLAVAFERSYRHLTDEQQTHLRFLAVLPVPFFAQAAAELWQMIEDEDEHLSRTRQLLRGFLERNLLEVDGFFEEGGIPATYRFQPVLHQEVARRLSPEEQEQALGRVGNYLAWFTGKAYRTIHQEGQTGLNHLAYQFLPFLTEQLALVPGLPGLWHKWWVGWLLQTFGQTHTAQQVLSQALPEAEQDNSTEGQEVYAALLFETAGVEVTLGQLDHALSLYQQALQLHQQAGDIQNQIPILHQIGAIFSIRNQLDMALEWYEKSLHLNLQLNKQVRNIRNMANTMHQMAGIFVTKGQLDFALKLYYEVLELDEQVKDIKSRAATFHGIAEVFVRQGQLNQSLIHYQQALNLSDQVKDIKGKSSTLSQMANLFMRQGEWERAEQLLQEALELGQRLNNPQSIAVNTVKLGRIAQYKGEWNKAKEQYEAGLAIHKQLGMVREVAQVEGFLQELQLAQLSPEEQAQLAQKAVFTQLTQQAVQVGQAYEQQKLAPAQAQEVAQNILNLCQQLTQDERLGSGRLDLIQFLQVVAVRLQGGAWGSVPPAYSSALALIQSHPHL